MKLKFKTGGTYCKEGVVCAAGSGVTPLVYCGDSHGGKGEGSCVCCGFSRDALWRVSATFSVVVEEVVPPARRCFACKQANNAIADNSSSKQRTGKITASAEGITKRIRHILSK